MYKNELVFMISVPLYVPGVEEFEAMVIMHDWLGDKIEGEQMVWRLNVFEESTIEKLEIFNTSFPKLVMV